MRIPLFSTLLIAAFSISTQAQLKQPAIRNPDTFTLAEIAEVTSLDPAFPYDNASQGVILNMYDTLIGFDGSSMEKMIPLLAAQVPSIENGLISQDGLVYRFPIRKGVKFHDGAQMTPEDVRYSLLRFMITDRTGGPSSLLLEPILGISSTRDSTGAGAGRKEAFRPAGAGGPLLDASGAFKLDFAAAQKAVTVSGDEVVIRLPRAFAPFLAIMARWSYVCSKQWAVSHGEWDGTAATWQKFNNPDKERSYFHAHANGTGPFKLERWDPAAKYVLLARNDGYWRKPAVLRRVLIKAVPEFSTRRLMLQAGDADIIEPTRPLLSQLENIKGVRFADHLPRLATDPALFFTFKINTFANRDIGSGRLDGEGIAPDFFTDPDVRKGFAHAFDYEALLKDTFKGTAQRAKGPIPPGVPGYDARQPFYEYDLKKAESHLRKAWNAQLWEKGFKFTLTYSVGSENREAACRILQKNIESLNPKFKIDLRGVEWASYLDKAQRRLMPIFSRGWYADYPDGHNFVHNFYHSAGRYPSAQGYSNTELDAFIEKAAHEVDARKRKEHYSNILRLAFEDAPSIVTVHPRGVYALRDWVKGFADNPVFLDIYFYPLRKAYGDQ